MEYFYNNSRNNPNQQKRSITETSDEEKLHKEEWNSPSSKNKTSLYQNTSNTSKSFKYSSINSPQNTYGQRGHAHSSVRSSGG